VKQILYIEDNAATQMMVARHLGSVAQLTVGASLGEARKLLSGRVFDLLLLDVYLPDGSSLELVSELRQRMTPQQLPVILVSSSMDQLLRAQAMRAGANDCFQMPVPWAVLTETVKKMLEEPYVRAGTEEAIAVTFVEGLAGNRGWIYCPELGVRLEGESAEQLRGEMMERLHEAQKRGVTFPFVRQVKVSQHLMKNHG
jgi:PleD family two-component response regulator